MKNRITSMMARMFTMGLLAAIGMATQAQQAAYPNKQIRFVVPYPAGSSTNVTARLVGQKLSEAWGQPVIIDNRPGGNTVIGTEFVAKSPPDGYTIQLAATSHVTNPHLLPSPPYDALKDFAPVATLIGSEFVLVAHPSVPANNLQELIALAKSKPGQLNYATSSTGGPTHLAAALLGMMTGTQLQQIPYKGAAPIMTDLVGGQVQLYFSPPSDALPFIQSGRLKAIAISGETRAPTLPQVPTFTEAGLPGFSVRFWYGVVAPAGTPKPIVDKLSAEIAKILAMPDVRQTLLGQGLDPFISTPEQYAALMRADSEKYARVIKAANIKADN